MSYQVNEVFYSLQGEGARAGSANVFVRFSGCNLQCTRDVEGFDCDTEFTSGGPMSAQGVLQAAIKAVPTSMHQGPEHVGVIFTGGEPTLQLDEDLLALFRQYKFFPLCIETNGLRPPPDSINWISCSPKTAEHTLKVGAVSELRYVRCEGMSLPRPSLEAQHYFISPAVQPGGVILHNDMAWCIDMVKDNPLWRLSVQQHKTWGVR